MEEVVEEREGCEGERMEAPESEGKMGSGENIDDRLFCACTNDNDDDRVGIERAL